METCEIFSQVSFLLQVWERMAATPASQPQASSAGIKNALTNFLSSFTELL